MIVNDHKVESYSKSFYVNVCANYLNRLDFYFALILTVQRLQYKYTEKIKFT